MVAMTRVSAKSAHTQRLAHLTSVNLISAKRRAFCASVFPVSQSCVGRSSEQRITIPMSQNGGNKNPYRNMKRARVEGSGSFTSYVGSFPIESSEEEYGGGIAAAVRVRFDLRAPKKSAS